MSKVTQLCEDLALPLAQEAGCTIWDVEYVREGGEWYLRVYLDAPEGVTIEQCEAVSRPLSDALDAADPIEGSYILEVSSPGLGRTLKKPEHFDAFLGSEVDVRLYRPRDGKKELTGVLDAYEDGDVTVRVDDVPVRLTKAEVALVRLHETY